MVFGSFSSDFLPSSLNRPPPNCQIVEGSVKRCQELWVAQIFTRSGLNPSSVGCLPASSTTIFCAHGMNSVPFLGRLAGSRPASLITLVLTQLIQPWLSNGTAYVVPSTVIASISAVG